MKHHYFRAGFKPHGYGEALWFDFREADLDEAHRFTENFEKWKDFGKLFVVMGLPDSHREHHSKEPCEYCRYKSPKPPKRGILSRFFPIVPALIRKPKNLRERELGKLCRKVNSTRFWRNAFVFQLHDLVERTNHTFGFKSVEQIKTSVCFLVRSAFVTTDKTPHLTRMRSDTVKMFFQLAKQVFHETGFSS